MCHQNNINMILKVFGGGTASMNTHQFGEIDMLVKG